MNDFITRVQNFDQLIDQSRKKTQIRGINIAENHAQSPFVALMVGGGNTALTLRAKWATQFKATPLRSLLMYQTAAILGRGDISCGSRR